MTISTHNTNSTPDNPLDREQILATLRQLAPTLQQQYGVTRLGIFGSVARNEATSKSDIDIVLELDIPDLFTMVEIKADLENIFQRSIDLIRYRQRMNPYLKCRIDHDAIYI
jgi:predicted nucleotidyltransferase